MANITGASLAPIYDRINATEKYHPYEAETFADWAMEAGDAVTLKRGNKNYKSPVHSARLTWKGIPTMSLSSTGNQERESISKVSKNKYRKSGYGRRNNRIDNGLWHKIEETDEYWRSYYGDEINGLYSVVEQTAEYWRASYTDLKNGLYSRVEQTAEYWRASLTDTENGLYSRIEQTASYWRASLEDTKNGLYSRIEQTAEYWRASLTDAENGLESLVEQTAAYWRSTLTDTENRLQTSIEQTASGWRVALSGVMSDGKVTAASIATAINNQGQAGVGISGDWIKLDGDTTLTGALNIRDGALHVQKTAYFGNDVYITGGNSLILQTSGTPATNYNLTPAIMASMIVKAAVSGNVLKLWTYGEDQSSDPALTFSKATSLSGEWASGVFTVTASPQGSTCLTSLTRGAITWSNGTATIPIKATINSGAAIHDTGYSPTLALTFSGSWSGRNYTAVTKHGTTTVGSSVGIVYDGLVASGSISKSGKNVSRSFIVYSDDGEGNADAVIMTKSVTISASSVYNDGWAAAYGKVTLPGSNTSSANFIVYAPPSTVDGSAAANRYSVANQSNNAVNVNNVDSEGNVLKTIARFTHGKYTAGYDAAHLSGTWSKTSSSLTNNNKITISKVTTGSSNSLNYVISAAASIAYNSTSNKFVATGQAKVDGTQRGDNATASSGEITIQFNNIQGSGASAYRTISVKNGSAVIRTSGNLTDYGDGYSAGDSNGYNRAYNNPDVDEIQLGSITHSSSDPGGTNLSTLRQEILDAIDAARGRYVKFKVSVNVNGTNHEKYYKLNFT